MLTSKPTLAWEVGEESESTADPWRTQAFDPPTAAPARRPWRRIVLLAALILLAAGMGVTHLVQQAEQNLAQTAREIELAAEADRFITDLGSDAVRPVRSTRALPRERLSVGRPVLAARQQGPAIELYNDLALVCVAAQDELAYETWFYRQTEQGWTRLAPDVSLWGPQRSRETAYFRFQYRQLDQPIVDAVSAEIDTFYREMFHDLGLGSPSTAQKPALRVAVIPDVDRIDLFYLDSTSAGIVVPSPRLLRLPATMTDAEALRQSLQALLALRAIRTAVRQTPPRFPWQGMSNGLRQWAHLAHSDLYSAQVDELHVLLRQRLAGEDEPRLPTLPLYAPGPADDPHGDWLHTVLERTIVEYTVATYGRARLALLVAAMAEHHSWQTLIPAVYDVSMPDFERAWQHYLATYAAPQE